MSCHLTPPLGYETQAARFGHSVSVSSGGGWLAVSAPYATRSGVRRSGAVFLYQSQGAGVFSLDQIVVTDYSLENDRFGWTCSVDELSGLENYSAVLVVGCWASGKRAEGRGGGFFQIYQRRVWETPGLADTEWALLHTYDPEGNGLFFGLSVSVSGSQFTCFTSTKVQILTPEELRAR